MDIYLRQDTNEEDFQIEDRIPAQIFQKIEAAQFYKKN